MNSIRERAISLLGGGISQKQVADTLGVTESWISQLMAEDSTAQQVTQLRGIELESRLEQDKQAETAEAAALKAVMSRIALVRSPLEAARIYQILNKRTQKVGLSTAAMDDASAQQVTITLPASAKAVLSISLNGQNQVIDIDGQTTAPLPSRALPMLAATREQQKKLAIDVPILAAPVQNVINKHQQEDSDRAAAILSNVKEMKVLLNGVECVL